MNAFEPIEPSQLAGRLISHLCDRPRSGHPFRFGLDAPALIDLGWLAEEMRGAAERCGVPTAVVDVRDFYRDASLRLEYGRTDVESFYTGWIDRAAIQREVLGPIGRGEGWYLPSLRDRNSNRMTRAARAALPPEGLLILTGPFLLLGGLDLDLVAHVSLSRQARRRRAGAEVEVEWTLPAYDRYDFEVDPLAKADVVVRYDDPRHPAVRWTGRTAGR